MSDYTVVLERIAWALETIANAVNEDPASSIAVRIVPSSSAHPEAPVLPLQDQPTKEDLLLALQVSTDKLDLVNHATSFNFTDTISSNRALIAKAEGRNA